MNFILIDIRYILINSVQACIFHHGHFLFLDLCYESTECTDGQFCQIDEGESQGECQYPDIENNSISAGKV